MRRILVLQVSGTKVDPFRALMMGHLQTLKILDCGEKNNAQPTHSETQAEWHTEILLISWRIPVPNLPHVFHDITLNPSNTSRFASVPYNQAISPSLLFWKYFRAKKKCFWILSNSLVIHELLKNGIHPRTIPYPTAGMVSVLTLHQSLLTVCIHSEFSYFTQSQLLRMETVPKSEGLSRK